MKRTSFRQILRAVNNYIIFFLTVSFAVSCCMMLFVSTLADSMGLVFDSENIAAAAKLTFGNVLLLTFLFTLFDYFRRKWTVERPVRRITAAAEKLMQGDFSVRIQPMKGRAATEGFNRIIDCFNKIAQELSGIETLRTDFIANVSHELKTPLAVMDNYAAMLRRPGLTEAEKNEYAQAISDAARRLANLITNILKLNKLENQQIFPVMAEYDLGEQLCEHLLQFERVWERAGIDIETDIADDVRIRADGDLLGLVWSNLLSNAFKFTPSGGKVTVSLTATEHHAIVCISDTGCGMSPEVGAHIFEKFYQGDTSHATQGNGLGLALVKRVIDILKGSIAVESQVGKGTTFTVRIRRT